MPGFNTEDYNNATLTPEQIVAIQKQLNAISIDIQQCVKTPSTKVTPGCACKVTYDQNGLVTGKLPLSESDIPTLTIDKISGLRNMLESSQPKLKKSDIDSIFTKSDIAGTACKVNYDSKGLIINSAPLTAEDIPMLDIDHIDGLSDIITELHTRPTMCSTEHDSVIVPSTACKVSFNQFGHIINTDKLVLSDLPDELLTRLNTIESTLTKFAPATTVSTLSKTVDTKIDANPVIEAGIYTKVVVDSKGLVTGAKKLTLQDLPEINISDIPNLFNELQGKVGIDVFNRLRDELRVHTASINMTRVNEVIDESIKDKVSISELEDITKSVSELTTRVDTITSNMPISSTINDSISNILDAINVINGKLNALENRINSLNS